MRAFAPKSGATLTLGASTTSGSTPIPDMPTGEVAMLLTNGGAVLAFVDFGPSTVAATSGDIPIPGGAQILVTVNNPPGNAVTHVAAITASSTANIYVTPGQGQTR